MSYPTRNVARVVPVRTAVRRSYRTVASSIAVRLAEVFRLQTTSQRPILLVRCCVGG